MASKAATAADTAETREDAAETPLLDSARYWLANGASPAATITTTWSSGSGHYALRSTIGHAASLTVMGDRFQKAKQSRIPAPPTR